MLAGTPLRVRTVTKSTHNTIGAITEVNYAYVKCDHPEKLLHISLRASKVIVLFCSELGSAKLRRVNKSVHRPSHVIVF